MATKNSRQPFNSVSYVNGLHALPSILRYYLLRKETCIEDYQSAEGEEEQWSICNLQGAY